MERSKIYKLLFIICLIRLILSCSSKSPENNQTDTDSSAGEVTYLISENKAEVDDTCIDFSEGLTYDIINNWLMLGLEQKSIIDSLGEPDVKGKDIYWGAIGTYVQNWKYNSRGISLEMESDQQNGNKHVLMITLIFPSTDKTSKLISVGSKREDVIKAYSEYISFEDLGDRQIVIGSIYGGVIFSLENGEVNKIFVGAAAE